MLNSILVRVRSWKRIEIKFSSCNFLNQIAIFWRNAHCKVVHINNGSRMSYIMNISSKRILWNIYVGCFDILLLNLPLNCSQYFSTLLQRNLKAWTNDLEKNRSWCVEFWSLPSFLEIVSLEYIKVQQFICLAWTVWSENVQKSKLKIYGTILNVPSVIGNDSLFKTLKGHSFIIVLSLFCIVMYAYIN